MDACAGVFKAWALVGNKLYAVPLAIPRTFFVNSVLPPGDDATADWGQPVRRTLPFGEAPHHVYQVRNTLSKALPQLKAYSPLHCCSRMASLPLSTLYCPANS